MQRRWAYGVTTVPERRELLELTLASLAAGGFHDPHLFVDGGGGCYTRRATVRSCRLRTAGSWHVALLELLHQDPVAHNYALFQDDLVCVRGLRAYLNAVRIPPMHYWNLFTFKQNEPIAALPRGWHPSDQHGRGAVALVFDREGVIALLSSPHLNRRATDTCRGWRAIDGGVSEAMRAAGYTELVHSPSLVQHTGDISAMGNGAHPKALSFPGHQFDAESWLTCI